jgi:flagellar motor switch protein FliM
MSTPTAATPPAAPAADATPVSVLTSKGVREERRSDSIRSHDFRQSGFLAPSELRRIRLRHEQFVRALAGRLASFLRLEINVAVSKLQIVGYQKFIEAFANPSYISLFKAEPLKGVGLLVLPTRLGLCLVDRLLGGAGKMPDQGRELSEIEIALTNQVSTIILSEWCSHWPEMRDLRHAMLGHESNSKFLQTSPAETAMLVLSLTVGLNEKSETFHLALPYVTLEPLVRLLCPAGMPESESAAARAPKPKWNTEFDDVTVPVTAEWQGLKLPASNIAALRKGDVLMLDPRCAAQVQLRFSHLPRFLGRPGTRGGRWAVELTSAIAD